MMLLRESRWLTLAATALLMSCGDSADTCTVDADKAWLRNYMDDWYLWAGSSPDPAPDGFASTQDYFKARLFTGNATVPADRWSHVVEDPATVNRIFDDGHTLGYGLFVNSQFLGYSAFVDSRLETKLPLKARFIEAQSPAAAAGLKRGDTIISINDKTSADIIADNDFSAMIAAREGDAVKVVVDNGPGPVTYNLVARNYAITPLPVTTVLSTAKGTKVGYLLLSLFITQAEAPLTQALDSIRKQGASELIVDLRYNTGGFGDTATVLASLIAGVGHAGQAFLKFNYNAKHQSLNGTQTLSPLQAPAFTRVLVLTGPRTCSASELIVNGLKPFADVVTLGGATCGKPYGFVDTPAHCGAVYQIVNLEVVNSLGQGQYYNGIPATCPVQDDFSGELGTPSDKLTAAALSYLDGDGACPL
jgi:carboxyl-terminal processing protease